MSDENFAEIEMLLGGGRYKPQYPCCEDCIWPTCRIEIFKDSVNLGLNSLSDEGFDTLQRMIQPARIKWGEHAFCETITPCITLNRFLLGGVIL